MNSNVLKIIACLSMLIDHVGFIMFPKVQWLRWVGRLAMPIFAFFIAEGCLKSSDRKKYFHRTLALAVFCQMFYLGEHVFGGGIREVYLNILFAFALAIYLGSKWLDGDRKTVYIGLVLLVAFELFCRVSKDITGVKFTLDYGLFAVLLPLYSVMEGGNMKWNMCVALAFYVAAASFDMSYAWLSLLSLPLLALYNGKRGRYNLKYGFYAFYPLHLAAIYGLNMII